MKRLFSAALLASACAACAPNAARVEASRPPAGTAMEVGLSAEGLTTGQPYLHHANVIAFGSRQEDVLAQLSDILGQPDPARPFHNVDCRSGDVQTAIFGWLRVNFEGGRFVGWTVNGHGGSVNLHTYLGLRVGLRRDEMDQDAEILPVSNSRLGTEVTSDGIGVGLTGPGPAARVSVLYAGKACFDGGAG